MHSVASVLTLIALYRQQKQST